MPRADLNRQKVVLAAAELLNQRGMQGLTLLTLATRLKVRSPSLYNHIDGWDDLLRELAIHGLRKMAEELQSAAVGKSGADALRAVAEAFRGFAKRNPGLYPVTVQAPAKKDREWNEVSDSILRIVARGLESYRLSKHDLIHALRAFRSTVHGFARLEAAGGFGLPQDVNESFRYLIEALIESIERRSKADRPGPR